MWAWGEASSAAGRRLDWPSRTPSTSSIFQLMDVLPALLQHVGECDAGGEGGDGSVGGTGGSEGGPQHTGGGGRGGGEGGGGEGRGEEEQWTATLSTAGMSEEPGSLDVSPLMNSNANEGELTTTLILCHRSDVLLSALHTAVPERTTLARIIAQKIRPSSKRREGAMRFAEMASV